MVLYLDQPNSGGPAVGFKPVLTMKGKDMNNRKLFVFCMLLICLLLLSGCGLRRQAENLTVSPTPAATAAPTPEAAIPEASSDVPAVIVPESTPVPESSPTPAPEATPAPVTTPAPEATPAPTQTPAQSNLPRVTKSPTDEKVIIGGSCWFVAKYENAIWAEWHFVSPDGSRDLDYTQAAKEFPKLTIDKGFASTMQLQNIPEALNGWKVYCRFSNNSGAVTTDSATITVTGSADGAPKVTKSPTGETVKAGENAYFVAKHEDAVWAVWHFVSPDGSRDLDYTQAAKEFSSLQIINGDQGTMQLKNIPAELNGWKVYCAFRNNVGSTNTGSATITVSGGTSGGTQKTAAAAAFDYTGTYVEQLAQRGTMKITGSPELYKVSVDWSGSYKDLSNWTFSGKFSDTGVLSYTDCVMTVVDREANTSQVKYTGGHGKLVYVDGSNEGVSWTYDNGETGEDTSFFYKN